jgi:hypothetical protein
MTSIDYFKFYHKVNKDRTYTCKSLNDVSIVMWKDLNGELDCTDYSFSEVTNNLQTGTWIIVE